ncbi:helix-turn-helix domain-containing protein [Brumimicrobium aurantiacum]|uniref:DNA-binding protein n=1 Tax=Brumimicrobium aurantiacum TaxID=1737063 RepID=A0A3E1EWX8_9FLAO|nr:helix-turn-helix domain-containing protein [Brumimicrobium aurantiacum]RFC54032.1 DNA-binding protein [Brumimicrobium aurantiacum]
MNISVVTREEMQEIVESIEASFEKIISKYLNDEHQKQEIVLLKSHQVQRMLGISPGTLQNMRVNGTLPFSKVGGVIFYDKQDILDLIEENKHNV